MGMRFFGAECLILIGYVTPNKWFVKRRGRAAGFLSIANAIQIGFGAIFQALIDFVGWRHAYFILSVIIGGSLLLVGIFYQDSPEVLGLKPDGEATERSNVEMTDINES